MSGGNDTPDKRNFWEVYTTGSWLNFLVNDDADQFKYFERMSTAMAEVCGGAVCMSDRSHVEAGEIHTDKMTRCHEHETTKHEKIWVYLGKP